MVANIVSAIRKEWKIAITFAVIFAALGVISEQGMLGISFRFTIALDVALGILVQHSILFGGIFGKDNFHILSVLKYFIKAFFIMFIVISVMVVIAIILEVAGVFSLSTENESSYLFIGVFWILASLSLAFLGTWLPAEIYGEKKKISDAFVRRKEKFLYPLMFYFVVLALQSASTLVVFNSLNAMEKANYLYHDAHLYLDIIFHVPSAMFRVLNVFFVFGFAAFLYKEYIKNENGEAGPGIGMEGSSKAQFL